MQVDGDRCTARLIDASDVVLTGEGRALGNCGSVWRGKEERKLEQSEFSLEVTHFRAVTGASPVRARYPRVAPLHRTSTSTALHCADSGSAAKRDPKWTEPTRSVQLACGYASSSPKWGEFRESHTGEA